MTCRPAALSAWLLVADAALGMRACKISADGRALTACASTPASGSPFSTDVASVSVNAAQTKAIVLDAPSGVTYVCALSASAAGGPLTSCGAGVVTTPGYERTSVALMHPSGYYAYGFAMVRVRRERDHPRLETNIIII